MNPRTRRRLETLREILVLLIVLVSIAAVVLLSQARPAHHDEAQVVMFQELERLVNEPEADEPQSRAPLRASMVVATAMTVQR